MISLFAIPSTDQSMFYLSQIFGNVGNLLNVPSSGAPLILGVMFKTFNSIILAVGVLIVLYVTVVGVIKTAHEGEFLGKHWNQLWVPIRMVLGIAALVPTASGYSAIQVVMMWIVIQGIGAADQVWTTVLNYVAVVGSPTTPVTIASAGIENSMDTLFQSLVCLETARAEESYTPIVGSSGGYFCDQSGSNHSSDFCKLSDDSSGVLAIQGTSQVQANPATSYSIKDSNGNAQNQTWSSNTFQMGPGGVCGSLTYCTSDSACNMSSPTAESRIRCAVCQGQAQVLQSVVSLLGGVAKMFAQADSDYRNYYLTRPQEPIPMVASYCAAHGIATESCCLPQGTVTDTGTEGTTSSTCAINFLADADGSQPDPGNANSQTTMQLLLPYGIQSTIGHTDFIQAASDNLVTALNNLAMNALQQAIASNTSYSDTYKNAKEYGWIFAGAYYYTMAQNNNKNTDAAQPSRTLSFTPASNPLVGYRNNYNAAGTLSDTLASQSQTSFQISVPPELEKLNKVGKALNSTSTKIMNSFYKTISGEKSGTLASNPLATLQHLGYILLVVAQVLFAVILVIVFALSILGFLNVFVEGTGFTNFLGPLLTTLGIFVAPLVSVLLGALFIFGATLAVYVPLIPYIVFTMGAISWFILVIEAMIASPLIALGILTPGEGHEFLGKSSHAISYVFNLFLRPTLMIFGMMAAMLLAVVVVTMINAGFSGVMGSIYQNPGLVEIILFLGAYVSLVITALNKCFALIHIIPDNVTRWIGHAGPAEAEKLAGEAMLGAEKGVTGRAGDITGAAKTAKETAGVAGKAWKGYGKAKGLEAKEDTTDMKSKQTTNKKTGSTPEEPEE